MMELEPVPIQRLGLWARFLLLPTAVQSLVIGSCIAALAGVLMTGVILSSPPVVATAPFYYDPQTTRATPYEVCPGDTLTYELRGGITSDARVMAYVYGVIIDSQGRTVWRMAADDAQLVTVEAVHAAFGPIEYSPAVSLPEKPRLEPGTYTWEHTVAAIGTAAATLKVEFAIPEGCP